MCGETMTNLFAKIKNKISLDLTLKAALCCLLWGTAFPVLKISYQELNLSSDDIFNRLVLAGMRFLLAGLLIGLFQLVRLKKIPGIKKGIIHQVLIIALLNTTLQYFFFYIGVANTGAIKGVLLDTSRALIVVVLAHFFTKDDPMSFRKIIGLVIGFTGIIIANLEGAINGGLSLNVTLMGEGALLMAALVYAIAVIYGKKVMTKISPITLNMYQFTIGALILLGVGIIGAGGYNLKFTGLAIVLLIYSAFLSAIAFVLWYQLIHRYRASSVSMYIFLNPIFGSIISSIVFVEESITINTLISLVMISISIIIVNFEKHSKTK
jgi:drug/metabolite transporter (DMT)-like permease